MPQGYKRAGDILVEQAAQGSEGRANVIYAILFCYRQSVELFLKSLIDEFGSSASRRKRSIHDLDKLWEQLVTVVGAFEADAPLGFNAARKLVMEFHDADEKSDGFRFATDTKGRAFPFGDRALDLENVRDVMNGLVNFFECVGMELSHRRDTP